MIVTKARLGNRAATAGQESNNLVITNAISELQNLEPELLEVLPRSLQTDVRSTMVLHMAMKAALPNDLELLRGPDLPCSTNHAFALQQGSGSVLYGGIEFLASHYCAKWPVALKIWTKADCSGEQVDSSHRMGSSCSDYKIQTTNVWVPYVLCLISHFPLHSLLGSYIRAMWLRWSGSPNCSRRVEEVERILRLPCPRPLDFVKISKPSTYLSMQIC